MSVLIRPFALFVLALAMASPGCDDSHGCMDTTADNFDPSVDKDDGSCIPARDKLIGYHDYYMRTIGTYNLNGSVIVDTIDTLGWMHITEANTDALDFKANVDGQWVFEGSVKRYDLEMLAQTVADTMQVYGTGLWYTTETDTVDMTITMNLSWSIPNFSYTATSNYYLHKRD